MTDTGFTFTQTVPINSTIPKVKVKFAANHLVYDRPDQLAVIVAKIELVAASPVYDDTFATVYGFPIEQTAANVNTVVTFPLQATTDSLGSGRYLKQVNGSPVEYKLTVTGRELGSETDIILVPGLKFHVDAEDTDNTFIIALAAAQDRPFLPSLTAAAKQQVATYIDQLIGLGAIVYDDGPLTARVTQAEADIAAIEVAEVAGIVFSPTLDNNVGDDGEYQRTADGNVYGPRSGGVYPGTPVATGGAGYDDTALDARVTQNESDIATNTADIASIVTGGLPFLVGPDPTGGDDATALQAFFDTFPATGANAFLPGGVYKTSVGLQIDSHNVTLWGAGPGQEDGATHDAQGTRIEAIGTLAGTPMLLVQDPGNTEPLHGVEIRNIALDGMGTATGAGLYYRSYRGIVSNVKIYRFAGKGFHAHGYPAWDLYESKLFNVEVSDSGWGLFWDDGATDMHVNHCVLYDNNIGWELFDGGSVQAVACHIYNSTVDNLFFNGAGSRSKFSGFKIEGAGRNGVNMDSTLGGSSDVQFANCNITSNTDTSTINTEDSFVIQGPSGNGITRVTISGCNFSTKSATQANNPRHFIYLATCAQQTVIVGNNFGPASHYGTSPIGGTGTALASATITGNGGSNINTALPYTTLDRAFSGGTFGSGTDATAHVQAKIDEIVAAGGGAIAIPADATFRITAPIEILSSNVTVFGFGDSSVLLMDEDDTGGPNTSAFYPAGGGIGMLSSFDVTDWNGSSSYTNLTFHNFRILGPNSAGTVDNWQSAGIDFGPVANDCSVTNVAFENLRGFSTHVRGSGTRFTFSNNRLVNGGNGININTDESSFVGNVCTQIEGLELSGAGLTVTGNTLRDCGRGFLAVLSVGGNIGGGAYYPGSVIANNTLRDCSAGITLADAADDGKIVGNTIIGTLGTGIQVGGGAITAGNEPNGASIENNTLRNIGGPTTPGGAAIGIWCDNVTNPKITGNTVLRTDGNTSDTDHGIYVQDCTNPTVTENHAGAANNAFFLRDSTGILYRGNEIEYGILQEQGTLTYRTRGSYLASGATKRSFTSASVTLKELADVVATVIDDTDDVRAEPIPDLATELTALSATSWYSWQDISTGSEQTLPNRVDGGAADATRGATTGSEASDPVFAPGSPISFDGTDDRMILAAADAPSYTDVTGQHTVMIYGTIPTTSAATRGLYASTAGNGNGLSMFLSGGSDLVVQTGNTVTVSATRAGNINDGIPRLMAAVIDNGQIKAYVSGQGLSAGTTITDDPSSVFIAPKIGVQGNTGGPLEFTLSDIVVIDAVALTEAQLDDLAAAFELAYPPVSLSGVTGARPIGTDVGYMFYDTTLGYPVWHDGAEVWVDATGTTA